jgi:hypothetical protein
MNALMDSVRLREQELEKKLQNIDKIEKDYSSRLQLHEQVTNANKLIEKEKEMNLNINMNDDEDEEDVLESVSVTGPREREKEKRIVQMTSTTSGRKSGRKPALRASAIVLSQKISKID